jgi:hypothetical protein
VRFFSARGGAGPYPALSSFELIAGEGTTTAFVVARVKAREPGQRVRAGQVGALRIRLPSL